MDILQKTVICMDKFSYSGNSCHKSLEPAEVTSLLWKLIYASGIKNKILDALTMQNIFKRWFGIAEYLVLWNEEISKCAYLFITK